MIFTAALPTKRAALRATKPRSPRPAGRRLCVSVRAENVLIVNTKKGGHAFVGLYLAQELQKARHTVTILNDGDSVRFPFRAVLCAPADGAASLLAIRGPGMGCAPPCCPGTASAISTAAEAVSGRLRNTQHAARAHAQSIESKAPFSEYKNLEGMDVVYGNPADPSTYPEGDFDVVYDNNGKSMDECQALIDTYAPKVRQWPRALAARVWGALLQWSKQGLGASKPRACRHMRSHYAAVSMSRV